MMEGIVTVLALAVIIVSLIGALAIATLWSFDKVLQLTRFSKVIIDWYGEKCTKERDAKRVKA